MSSVLSAVSSGVRFLWVASAGNRLRPWRSPYLRWRMETYTGKPASSLVLSDFLRLGWRERGQVLRYLRWLGELDGIRKGQA